MEGLLRRGEDRGLNRGGLGVLWLMKTVRTIHLQKGILFFVSFVRVCGRKTLPSFSATHCGRSAFISIVAVSSRAMMVRLLIHGRGRPDWEHQVGNRC